MYITSKLICTYICNNQPNPLLIALESFSASAGGDRRPGCRGRHIGRLHPVTGFCWLAAVSDQITIRRPFRFWGLGLRLGEMERERERERGKKKSCTSPSRLASPSQRRRLLWAVPCGGRRPTLFFPCCCCCSPSPPPFFFGFGWSI